jgi:hypothetical protein
LARKGISHCKHLHACKTCTTPHFPFTFDFTSLFSTFDFLVGDWNIFPDPHRECVRAFTHQPTPALLWPLLAPCLTTFVDAAFIGASERYYTFESPMYQYQARLDHTFVHAWHALLAVNTSLYPFSHSDHTGAPSSSPFYTDSTPHFYHPLLFAPLPSLVLSHSVHHLTGKLSRSVKTSAVLRTLCVLA